jgi:glycosyltransferase involved in cell wall biosynthesis
LSPTGGEKLVQVSFLTTLFNDRDTIEAAINSCLDQATDRAFEVLVIDDGSTDGSAERVESIAEHDDRVRLIRCKHAGQAAALNAGLSQALGEFVAIVESDVRIEPYWLEQLLEPLSDAEVLGAGGSILTPPDDPWIGRLGGYEIEYRLARREKFTPHVTAAAAVYKKEAFDKFGVWPEDLPHACPDVEFNLRITRGGFKLAVVPEAMAWHHSKPSLFGYLRRQFAYGYGRPFLGSVHLYKRDISITLQMLFSLLLTVSIPATWFSTVPLCLSAIGLLLVQAPVVVETARKKHDFAVLAMPPLMFLRSIAGMTGLVFGTLRKLFR